ncbi:MAG: MG2 domain-containing protein [Chloroflexota bacterium]
MFKKSIHLILFASLIFALFGLKPGGASAAASKRTATPTRINEPTPNTSPTPTATPNGPYAWLDETVDLESFSPLAEFKVHFSAPVNTASIGGEAALLIFPWINGKLTWNAEKTTLSFQPSAPLTPAQAYHAYINPRLTAANGEALAGVSDWTFTVGDVAHISHRLSAAQPDANLGPTTTLTFDHPMNSQSVTAALSVQPALPLSLTWQGDTHLAVTVMRPLAPGQQLAFTLAGSATDAAGVPIVTAYHWYVSAPAFTVKLDEALSAGPSGPQMVLRFSHAMDADRVADAIRFSPPLSATLRWPKSNELQVLPADPAAAWFSYQISFEGQLLDGQAHPLPQPESIRYLPPAPIFPPADEAIALSDPTLPLDINFLVPVDRASAEAGFRIDPPIAGALRWFDETLSFQPEKALLAGQTYTVTLGTAIKSADGRPILSQTYQLVYRLDRVQHSTHFGERGANIQVVDADGARAVQFQDSGDGPLSFRLYRFDLAAFIDLYRRNYEFGDWRESGKKVIPTEAGKLTAYWEWSPKHMDARAVIPEVSLPGDAPAGLYVLNMNGGDTVLDQLFVVLTRNTLVVKKTDRELFVWASDINGASTGNIEMQVYGQDGTKLLGGKADANGLYRATLPAGAQAMLVVARSGEDYALSGLQNGWGWSRSGPAPYKTYPYTDRPIYRPGQTVYFKAIARADQDAQYSPLPAGTPVTLRICDPRGNVLQTLEQNANAFGSVNGEFQLSEGAALGEYKLEVLLNGYSTSQTFKVQDYRKPDMQIGIHSDAAQYVAGDAITLTVSASYFFGQPVTNAHVVVKRYRISGWAWYPDGTIAEGQTDANGVFTAYTTATFPNYGGSYSTYGTNSPQPWGVEVTLEDESGQAVSSAAVIRVYQAAEIARLDVGSWLKPPGKAFDATLTVTAIEGTPVEGRDLLLEVRQWDTEDYSFKRVIATHTLATDAAGQATASLSIEESGYYELRTSGQDGRGNEITLKRYLFVYKQGDTWANAYHQNGLKISADQSAVSPNTKTRLMIESTFSGPAMITFERGCVHRARPVTLTAPLTIIEVDILPEDAPNIYVTVNAWQAVDRYPPADYDEAEDYLYWDSSQADSTLHRASVELRVDASSKALNVAIRSDNERYAPGQTAIFTVTVTNAQGRPVEAELSVALVDEAIYTLSGELTPPIFNAFYGRRSNTVYTYNSMAPSRSIRSFDAGRGGGGEGDIAASFRADFPDVAAWYPAVVTNKSGVAIVKVALPDNLTTWRVVVRAVTKTTLVGEATHAITTQKAIVVRPQLPRTLAVGDEVTLSAFVHNYDDAPHDVQATITINQPGIEITGALTQSISLEAGAVQLVNWQARMLAAGEPQVSISALLSTTLETGGQHAWIVGDAVQLPLTIQPLAVPAVTTQLGTFQTTLDAAILVPTNAISQSVVRVDLSRSVAGSLLDGLEYLTGYPYGCVEQTMSRALPNAVIGRAFEQFDIDPGRKEALLPLVQAGLQRLYGQQHNDGGWGWWYDDASDAYQTAWVLFGLAVTADAGYEVDPAVMARAAGWLHQRLDEMDARTAAYALYSMALARHGDLAATENIYATQLAELDPFSQAALALAYHELGAGERAHILVDRLAAAATPEGTMRYWPQPGEDGGYQHKTLASTTRTTALVLDAIVQITPQSKLIPGAVQWLMAQRRPQGWGTTNETAYTILALSDHLLGVRQALGMTNLTVELNGEQILSAGLDMRQPQQSIEIPFEMLQSGVNHLRLRQTSAGGDVYYRIYQRLYLAEQEVEAAGTIAVRREYVAANGSDRVAAGDLVEVHLFVTLPQDGYYMILEDRLPGGLEALNDKLNNSGHVQAYPGSEGAERFYWRDYGYNNKEIRADRVSFFITEMAAGEYEFVYLVRATRPGSFVAPPAEIYAMYNESLWGRSANGRVAVLAK